MAIEDIDFEDDEEKAEFELLSGHHVIGVGKKKVRLGRGDTFMAYPSRVEWMGARIRQLSVPKPKPRPVRTASRLTKVHKGGGKYAVINEATKEAINDRLLTSEEADSIINDVAIDDIAIDD